jgi:hypothetical protein
MGALPGMDIYPARGAFLNAQYIVKFAAIAGFS